MKRSNTSKKPAAKKPNICKGTLDVAGDGTYHCTKQEGHSGNHQCLSNLFGVPQTPTTVFVPCNQPVFYQPAISQP